MISLSGDMETVDLPDVLSVISQNEKSGVFTIRRGMEEKKLYFKKGMLVFASSTDDSEKLGEVMLQSGLIDEKTLIEARRRQVDTNERIGNILMTSGIISQDNLIQALKAQISKILSNLLNWWGGYFTFDEGDFPIPDKVVVGFDLKGIIMEAATSADEWMKVQKKIPSTDVVPRMKHEMPDGVESVEIDRMRWRVFSLIDGRRTIREICSLAPYADMVTCRFLVEFAEKGVVDIPRMRDEDVSWENQLERSQIEPVVDFYNEVFRLIHRRSFDIDKKNARTIIEKAYLETVNRHSHIFNDLDLRDDGSLDRDIVVHNILGISRTRRVEVVQDAFNDFIITTLKKLQDFYGKKEVNVIQKEVQNLIDFLMHREGSILSKLGVKEGINLLIESM